ncbi:hypothetical protein E6Q11_01810 [Candidatus Dojkabacteria bacterium]|uniref:P22 coat protein-protein 5 domain protein n=1 Tax=Candidatus Dojkabacteria bacterium TaxID=2099670 RepID=A0A5C7JBZ2_9BACT|nr:MAG: hypothetical protein E6Q11_01810 [Candidatus Dojkabacteria bacterium]
MAINQNIFQVIDKVLPRGLAQFQNNLMFLNIANNDYEQEFNNTTGTTIRIRKPMNYLVREGSIATPQPIDERADVFVVADQIGVDISVSSIEEALKLDNMYERVFEPAMENLANKVDMYCAAKLSSDVYNAVGNPGSGVSQFSPLTAARQLLLKQGVVDPNFCVMNMDDSESVKVSLQNTYNTPLNIDVSQRFMLGKGFGMNIMENQNVFAHTNGSFAGTPLIDGANQSGDTLSIKGFTANELVLKAGDIIYFDGTNPVYMLNKRSLVPVGVGASNLQKFIVKADVTSDSSGNASVDISPSIVLSGAYQNVNTSPADNQPVLLWGSASGTYTNNFIFPKSALSICSIQLPKNMGAAYSNTQKKGKVALRVNSAYDYYSDKDLIRIDALIGTHVFSEYCAKANG